MMARALPPQGEALIKRREEKILRVYDDKRPRVILKPGDHVEGVLTAGFGHTAAHGEAPLTIGMMVTDEMAERWFLDDVRDKVVQPLLSKIGGVIYDLNDNQWSALCCFVFNLGTGDPRKPEWTIWKRLRAKQFDQVPIEMAKFVNWNGSRSNGLVARRNDEIALWSKAPDNWQAADKVDLESDPPSSVTRREPTPPTQADPTPAHRSGAIIASIASATAAAPTAINQAIDQLEPFSWHSETVQHWMAVLATVGAALAIASAVLIWLKHRREQH